MSSVGDYDECINIQHELALKSSNNDGTSASAPPPTQVYGRHCFARPIIPFPPRGSYHPSHSLNVSRPFSNIPKAMIDELIDVLTFMNGSFVNFGLCLPSTCSVGEIEQALNTGKSGELQIETRHNSCSFLLPTQHTDSNWPSMFHQGSG